MSDRVWAEFELGGHIETIKEMELLIESIEAEGVTDTSTHRSVWEKDQVKASLRKLLEDKKDIIFYGDEVNYGSFDTLEAAVKDITGLGCTIQWHAGANFEAGIKTILPNREEYLSLLSADYGPTIPVSDLREVIIAADPVVSLTELINHTELASGSTLPPFTVSPAVAAWLKIFSPKS